MPRGEPTKTIGVRFTDQELEALQVRADELDIKVARLAHDLAMEALPQEPAADVWVAANDRREFDEAGKAVVSEPGFAKKKSGLPSVAETWRR